MQEQSAKSLPISKKMVYKAYQRIKKNKGGAGVDNVSWSIFEKDKTNQLYKLWNRLSSGSYFPPPVRIVEIPKKDGISTRQLGIPTIGDRIAQQVLKDYLEPRLEKIFSTHSYGYRPLKSAHQALSQVRANVRWYPWVVDLDIAKFFDNMSHELLEKALSKHVQEKWVKMYIQRWLKVSYVPKEGKSFTKSQGVPQGGVISPLLANLFLHYTLDKWLEIHHPNIPFVRYADDLIVHCKSENQARFILDKINHRLSECKLTHHPQKTKIVYCQDYRRKKKGFPVKFDFLGFSFQPRATKPIGGTFFIGYDCAISQQSKCSIYKQLRESPILKTSQVSMEDIAIELDSRIRGWIAYYGKFRKWELSVVFNKLHQRLIKWVRKKYKMKSYKKAYAKLKGIKKQRPNLFYHWEVGYKI